MNSLTNVEQLYQEIMDLRHEGMDFIFVIGVSGAGKSYLYDNMRHFDWLFPTDIDEFGHHVRQQNRTQWFVRIDKMRAAQVGSPHPSGRATGPIKTFFGWADNLIDVIKAYEKCGNVAVIWIHPDPVAFRKIMALKGAKDTPYKEGFLKSSTYTDNQIMNYSNSKLSDFKPWLATQFQRKIKYPNLIREGWHISSN